MIPIHFHISNKFDKDLDPTHKRWEAYNPDTHRRYEKEYSALWNMETGKY